MKKKEEQWVGMVIGEEGRYQLAKPLGSGGEGSVFLGWDRKLRKYWAVKITRQEQGRRESAILRLLSHRGIVVMSDYLEQEGLGYLVMEYVQGENLHGLLQRAGSIGQAQARAWMEELMEILGYLHRAKPAVYYLDLKPSNIVIMQDGHIKLVDFGSARRENDRGTDCPGMGTYGYAAPELAKKAEGARPGAQCDIYGLGMTVYAMVSGFSPELPPYGMRPAKQWQGRLTPEFAAILLHCCEQSREKRCADLESLRMELSRMKPERRGPLRLLSGCCSHSGRDCWRQKKSLFVPDKRRITLFLAGMMMGGILSARITGLAQSCNLESQTAPLLVSLLAADGRKILLREGSAYSLEGDLLLEIPGEYLWSNCCVTVAVQGGKDNKRRERSLLIALPEGAAKQ